MTVAEDVVGALLATGVSIRGDVGEQGPKGEQGDRGPQGPKGKDGRNGTDGKDGVGPDEKVKLNASDPEAGFLDDKLEAGRGIYLIKKRGSNGDKLVIEAPSTGMVGAISGGAGPAGPPGQGVPTGGTTGQVLAKASNANFDTEWAAGGTGAVDSVNGETGVVVIEAAEVPFTPAGGISATNVQAAIEEVSAEAGGGSGLPPQWTDGGSGDVTATVDDVAATPLTLEAMAGQTGHLFRWYDENGDLKGDIDFEGILDATHIAVQTPPDTGDTDVGSVDIASVPVPHVLVEAGPDIPAGSVLFRAGTFYLIKTPGLGADNGYVEFTQRNNADTMFLMVAAAAPESDHLQLWNNAFDAKLFRIFKTGAFGTSANAAPPDGDLSANEMGVYFDPTNGAASPRWKGKSADGTVVSGSLGGGSVTPAIDPGDIADPTIATAEDVALKVNALMGAMRTAGMLA